MSVKTYLLYCEICHYKRITDGSDVQDLCEVKTSPIPREEPHLDPEAKPTRIPQLHGPSQESTKIIVSQPYKQVKKFKCPKCGRIVTAKKITPTEHDNEENKRS